MGNAAISSLQLRPGDKEKEKGEEEEEEGEEEKDKQVGGQLT